MPPSEKTQERKETLQELLPLYLAAYIVILCGISSVNSTVENSQLTTATVVLSFIGTCLSLGVRLSGINPRTMGYLTGLVVLVALLFNPQWLGSLVSVNAFAGELGYSAIGPGIFFEWCTVAFSFALVSDFSLIFSTVPSMAMIGLMASENLNPEMITYFLGFSLASVFLMGYEAYLSHSRRLSSQPLSPATTRLLLILTVWIVLGAGILGISLAFPLQKFGRELVAVVAERLTGPNLPFLQPRLLAEPGALSLSGLPPNLSDQIVMRVKCSQPLFWRSAVYDRYLGNYWEGTSQVTRITGSSYYGEGPFSGTSLQEFDLILPHFEPVLQWLYNKRQPIRQTFLLETIPLGTLYAAAEPVKVLGNINALEIDPLLLTLRPDSSANPPTIYQVISLVPQVTPEELRKIPDEPTPPDLYRFLQLPRFSPRVKRLVERIVEGLDNRYDRVIAVERFLRENCTYTLEPPLLPEGEDATEFFLFRSRTGYCEQFASAMAVMLRHLGIPARVAVGFAQNPHDKDPRTGLWNVRERDAHAWVEVFFPQYGWITFDPTAGATPENTGPFNLAKIWNRIQRALTSRQFVPRLILYFALGLILYAFKIEFVDRFISPYFKETWQSWKYYRYTPYGKIGWVYRQLCRWGSRLGVRKTPSETPLEFQNRLIPLATQVGAPPHLIQRIISLYLLAAFSPYQVDESQAQEALSLLRQLYKIKRKGLQRAKTEKRKQ